MEICIDKPIFNVHLAFRSNEKPGVWQIEWPVGPAHL